MWVCARVCVCARTGLGQATEDSLGNGQVVMGRQLGLSWRPVASSVFFVFFLSSPKSLCLSPHWAARIPPRGGDGPSHESEDFPRPLVTLPGRQPQQRPWWTGWFGKAA